MNSRENLVDICSIRMRADSDSVENAGKFFREIQNPYHFRVHDIAVHVQFAGVGAVSLQSCVERLLAG